MEWLEHKMLPAEARMTQEDVYWRAKLSIDEEVLLYKAGLRARRIVDGI
ncbi:hypothetical protein [Paenibacillus sp. KS-LC4]